MKVIICKCFSDHLGDKLSRLVAREKSRTGDNFRIFCVAERTRQELDLAGVPSEIFHEFSRPDFEDEATYEIVYRLSDGLHLSADNNDKLSYSGINFLTLEHFPIYYLSAVRLSGLFRRMAKQKCEVLIVVLDREVSSWVGSINTENIRTIEYGKSMFRSKELSHHIMYQVSALWGSLTAVVKTSLKKSTARKQLAAPVNEEQIKQPKALFVVSTFLYARPTLAIVEECLRSGLVPWVTTNDRNLTQQWQSLNIDYSVRPSFSTSIFSIVQHSWTVVRLFCRLRQHINSFFSGGKAMPGLDEFSEAYLCQKTLLTELPQVCYEAISDIMFLEKQVKIIAPDLICLMPHDHFFQQIAWALAKKYNLPTLTCSAAWEIGGSPSFRRHLHSDILATSGPKMRDIYIKDGLEPQRVIATGIAHFDRLIYTRNTEQDKRVLIEHGIDPDARIVVFATDHILFRETEEMLVGVIEAVLKLNAVHLVVKVHPREEVEPYQRLIERYRDSRLKAVRDIDLYALLNNCELLITKLSTVALEAMIIDKPVITINLSGEPVSVPYAEEGAALGVHRYEGIEPAILKALYDKTTQASLKAGRDEFVRNWSGEPGKTSQKIVALMKKMISQSNA